MIAVACLAWIQVPFLSILRRYCHLAITVLAVSDSNGYRSLYWNSCVKSNVAVTCIMICCTDIDGRRHVTYRYKMRITSVIDDNTGLELIILSIVSKQGTTI